MPATARLHRRGPRAGFACVLACGSLYFAGPAFAQRPLIHSITVCGGPGVAGVSSASCPPRTNDTAKPVLAPDGSGNPINLYGGLSTLADEHSTIFPPGSLNGNAGYLFFVASKTRLNAVSSGLVALASSGPDATGHWTLDFAPDFGLYKNNNPAGSTNGQLFLSPTQHNQCPTVQSGGAAKQDQTFDLNYADPGTVFIDPSNAVPGNLLMLYEGTTRCIGLTGGTIPAASASFYSTLAIATSGDYGITWPTYAGTKNFTFVDLPAQSASQGPSEPAGALGSGLICDGNSCPGSVAANYGRYAVVAPQTTIASAMAQTAAAGTALANSIGNSEPSAFLDDAGGAPLPYVYTVHNYNPGDYDPSASPAWTGAGSDLVIARAQLNGGTAPLTFFKWYAGSFSEPGIGGYQTPIFPSGSPANCLGSGQLREMGSISYVDETRQYLLLFVCRASNDPATGTGGAGAAWFYSTNDDVSRPDLWSAPPEISGSWSPLVANANGCGDFAAYPSIMSLNTAPGHLSSTGWVFYMQGCPGDAGGGVPPPTRTFSTRQFTMTIRPAPPAGAHACDFTHGCSNRP